MVTFLNHVNPWTFCVGVEESRGMAIGRRKKRAGNG